jgi:Cytochrome P450
MSFVSYELAMNPDIQKRLRDEVDAVHESLKGAPLKYENLQEMKYLDCVISGRNQFKFKHSNLCTEILLALQRAYANGHL